MRHHIVLSLLSEMVRGIFYAKIELVQKVVIYFYNADKLRVINRKIKIIIHIFMNNF